MIVVTLLRGLIATEGLVRKVEANAMTEDEQRDRFCLYSARPCSLNLILNQSHACAYIHMHPRILICFLIF